MKTKNMFLNRFITLSMVIALLLLPVGVTLSVKAESIQGITYNSISIAKCNTTSAPTDCQAIYNGFNNRYYTCVRYGWKVSGGNPVIDNAYLFTPTNFQTAKHRPVLYYSGHGTKAGVINGNINIASATASWDKSTSIKAFLMHACHQMDKGQGNALKYAQLMKRTNIQVCTGFHEQSSAGYHRQTAEEIIRLANAGNSVKYSWQYGVENTESRAQYNKWGYLVYNASIQYYRFPDFPGSTYPLAPNADIILARKGLSNFIFTNASLAAGTNSSIADVPLYISVTSGTNKEVQSESMRESDVNDYYVLVNDLQVDKAMVDASVKESLQKDTINDMVCVVSPVILCSVDTEEEKYGEDKITEYVYTYYNAYNGIPISDSFVKKFADKDGIYTTTINKKSPTIEVLGSKNSGRNFISEADALNTAIKSIDGIMSKTDINFAVKHYIPVDGAENTYKLMYVIELMDGSVYYVDAENAQVMDVQTLTVK
jgi:hypothetical protein